MFTLKIKENSNVLYNETVVVFIISDTFSSLNFSGPKRKLSILFEVKPTTGGNELLLRVTDGNDPLVLYTCVITETDYHTLRREQGLLVDFAAFPQKLTELIKTCLSEEGKENPRFILALKCAGSIDNLGDLSSTSAAALEVIELNVFKHLCHLSLALSPSSTHAKLLYLAENIRSLKTDINTREKRGVESEQKLQTQLTQTQEQLALKCHQLEELKEELAKSSVTASERQAHLLNHEKEKLLKAQSDADRRLDRERREIEARVAKQVEDLQKQIASLSLRNTELNEKKVQVESSENILRNRFTECQRENRNLHVEASEFKKQNEQLDRECRSIKSIVRNLEGRIFRLESELRTKENQLQHSKQSLEVFQTQKIHLEECLEEKKVKVSKREASIQQVYGELQKALEVIRKLKKRVAEEHLESEVRGTALREQEKVLQEQGKRVSQLTEEVDNLQRKLDEVSHEKETSNKELKAYMELVAEQQKTLKTNDNVISWLNKQLNDVETSGALVRRAPLAEVYPGLSTAASMDGIVHSTPITSTAATAKNSSGGKSSAFSSKRAANISPIPEEHLPASSLDKDEPRNKENSSPSGLNPEYLQPSSSRTKGGYPSAFQIRGLIRAPVDKEGPLVPEDLDPLAAKQFSGGRSVASLGAKRGGATRGTRGGAKAPRNL